VLRERAVDLGPGAALQVGLELLVLVARERPDLDGALEHLLPEQRQLAIA